MKDYTANGGTFICTLVYTCINTANSSNSRVISCLQ